MAFGIFPFLFFPIWIVLFMVFLAVLIFIFWIWAIIDCLSSKLSVAEKLFWIIIIVFFHIIGALIYYIFTKVVKRPIMKVDKKGFKGKKLFRNKKKRVLAGVCGGLGKYLGVDPTIIRLLWVLFTFFSIGAGLLAYIVAWIIIPEEK